MSRLSLGALVSLIVAGWCCAALLSAQDSSGRARYRSPYAADNQDSQSAAGVASGNFQPSAYAPPNRFPGAVETAVAVDPNATPTAFAQPPADLDAASDGMRSVLRRDSPPPMQTRPMQSPASFAAENEAPAGEALPRRRPMISPPASATPPSAGPRTTASVPARTGRSTGNVTVSGKTAALKVEVVGPPGITVGKPSTYTVHLTNEGDQQADEVQLRIAMPSWASAQAIQPSSGEAGGDSQAAGRLLWNLPSIAPRARETLQLQLLTRQGDAFDLDVEWTARPAAVKAAIAVQQPQLALTLAGPSNMVFGEEKTFALTVSNPGSGDAERVIVTVTAGDAPPQQFDAGTIPAGHKKDVPLAVVASQAGSIDLQVVAAGENGLEARTAAKVDVRKAEVTLALEGPAQHFAGSAAAYLLTVANQGTAAADNINLSLTLPAGAKYLSGLDGASAAGNTVKWRIGALPPGGDRQYNLQLQLTAAGANQIAVESQATASGTASCSALTQVEAVADLKLVVNDPAGPLSTANEAVYEIQVMNRGSLAARQVKIVMQFSEGMEPVRFEGCEARVVPGQVLCHPLPQLGPGEQASLRVVAKAQQAGNHQFRVEVTATEGEARLVSEGTTRFFVESGRANAAASTARKSTSAGTSVR